MSGRDPYVLWLKDCTSESLPKVGGKNASLGEMTKAGIPVPPGFAITTDAYNDFLREAGLKEKIQQALAGIDVQDTAAVDEASKTVRQLIESAPTSPKIEQAISASCRALGEECNIPDIPVALRSSATAEDLPGASFAGQQETFLWVSGLDQILDKFKVCMSSLFTSRAISYRIRMGFPHEKVLISVGVQKMVNAKTAGVMFTLNPKNGDRSKVTIEANWGLGESVVNGEVTPDAYLADKVSLELLKRNIGPKIIEHARDPNTGKVVIRDVPSDKQNIQCVSDEEILELVRLGKLIERHYGTPQDIEWAFDADLPFPDNTMILQSRPETVWSQRKPERVWEPKANILDIMLDRLMGGKISR